MEALRVGDLVVNSSGEFRPIKKLRQCTDNSQLQSRSNETTLVCFAAHAFGPQRPTRDLYVPLNHLIAVDFIGEFLLPAAALVNNATAQRVSADGVLYWEIELDTHDIILAENLTCGTDLALNQRSPVIEDDGDELNVSHDAHHTHRANLCRPHYIHGRFVEAVRGQMRARATELGWELSNTLHVHLEVDGQRVHPAVHAPILRFLVPFDAKEVWLISPAARPYDTIGALDRRTLGIDILSLTIDNGFSPPRNVKIHDPSLSLGFCEVENGYHRWTDGRARLPAALWKDNCDDFFLLVKLGNPPLERWLAPNSNKGRHAGMRGECLLRGGPWAQSRAKNSLSTLGQNEVRPLRGCIDFWNGKRLIGWAHDATAPKQAVHLEFVVEGKSIARTRANLFRGDLLDNKIGDGHHGFDIKLNVPLAQNVPVLVVMQRIADGLVIGTATTSPKESAPVST